MNKRIISQICPPLIWNRLAPWLSRVRRKGDESSARPGFKNEPGMKGNTQDCDIYWDEDFAKVLETWGEGNAWREIEMFMVGREGRVLDIACGTGKVIEILSRFPGLALYGCDISDLLIQKALDRGIAAERLKVCDATETGYPDGAFDYAYSIGSLEHFTEEGILKAIHECRRIVKKVAFHQMPVSRSGENEGWIKPLQSYYNNSAAWWLEKFRTTYNEVHVLDSAWQDSISVGKWFVCR
jgi:ubiquinone/menaquinone biosynthesis C-methylase UbiE